MSVFQCFSLFSFNRWNCFSWLNWSSLSHVQILGELIVPWIDFPVLARKTPLSGTAATSRTGESGGTSTLRKVPTRPGANSPPWSGLRSRTWWNKFFAPTPRNDLTFTPFWTTPGSRFVPLKDGSFNYIFLLIFLIISTGLNQSFQ